MSFSRILFIGLGGAGQRHLRIFHQLLQQSTVYTAYRSKRSTPLLRPDFSVNEKSTIETEYDLQIFDRLVPAFATGPNLTVISTPTSLHREPLMLAMESGSGIIVEKPWAESLEGFKAFRDGMLKKQLPFLISFQRRYHPLIAKTQQLISKGKIGKPMVATFTVFSDVTTWHGYEDWRTLYAVRKDLGGGVLLTEIHEIDLAYWFFGLPKAVHCTGGNRSTEKIDVEDTVQITLLYEAFSVQITLCFMHKKRMRYFHIAGTEGALSWNEENNKLVFSSSVAAAQEFTAPDFTNDAMFIAQAEHFISNWSREDSEASLLSAGCSLAIVEAAKRSMESGAVEKIDTSIFN